MKPVIFFLCFSQIFYLFGQQQIEKIIEHKQKKFRFIQYEYINYEMKIQYIENSKVFIINKNKLFTFSLNSLAYHCNTSGIPSLPSGSGWSQLKYRFGDWYCRKDNVIYQFVSENNKWKEIYKQNFQFSQFEIDSEKLIYLICCGKPQYRESRSNQHSYLDDAVDGSVNALVVFSDPTGPPLKTIPLPAGFAHAERQVSLLSGLPLSFWHQGQLILASPDLGLVWCYQPVNQRLIEVEVPWPSLGMAHLEQSRPAVPLTMLRAGVKAVSQLDFPDYLGLFPYDDGRMFVIVRFQEVTPKKVEEAMAVALQFPYTGSFLLPEMRPSRIGFYAFDTLNHRIQQKPLGREEAERLRKAIQKGDWDGRWVTLDGMLWDIQPCPEPPAPAPSGPGPEAGPS